METGQSLLAARSPSSGLEVCLNEERKSPGTGDHPVLSLHHAALFSPPGAPGDPRQASTAGAMARPGIPDPGMRTDTYVHGCFLTNVPWRHGLLHPWHKTLGARSTPPLLIFPWRGPFAVWPKQLRDAPMGAWRHRAVTLGLRNPTHGSPPRAPSQCFRGGEEVAAARTAARRRRGTHNKGFRAPWPGAALHASRTVKWTD